MRKFDNGVRFYTGTMSPHVQEREINGYSSAWLHHKGCNKHHFEYWCDNLDGQALMPVPMPTKYLAEMICDRVAASMIYLDNKYTDVSPLEYYQTHRYPDEFHPETRYALENYLFRIQDAEYNEYLKEFDNKQQENSTGKTNNESSTN